MRILICDDTEAIRRELRIGLEAEGFAVVGEAADGVEADRLADDLAPDAFIIDLSMPRRDGLELVPDLRQRFPSARIVVFSGFEAQRMQDTALRLGADAYLEKGCPFSDLVAALGSATAVVSATLPAVSNRSRRPVRPHGALDAISEAHERELARVSERLHDGPIQVLTASTMLLRGASPARVERIAAEVASHLDDVIAELRDLMSHLAPWNLGGASYDDAIRGLVDGGCRRGGLLPQLQMDDLSAVPAGVCDVVFRSVQEATANVVKHAGASRLLVEITHRDDRLELCVHDDGRGFDPEAPTPQGHFGLQLMRRRIEASGGSLDVTSTAGMGTSVTARWPLPSPATRPQSRTPGRETPAAR